MIMQFEIDPRGEYYRVCPYCKDEFIAKHLSRKYCKEKNGKNDWCKNRYKRIVKNNTTNNPTEDYEPDIVINVAKLERLLNGARTKLVKDKELFKIKYNFNAYTTESPVYRDNFYSVIVDSYSVEIVSVNRKGACYKITNLDYYKT
jgi:hypothetical protein